MKETHKLHKVNNFIPGLSTLMASPCVTQFQSFSQTKGINLLTELNFFSADILEFC